MTPHETDQLLDRTLRALADAQPSPGFTNRIEARLAQRSPAQSSTAETWRRFSSLRYALPLSLAAVLSALTLFFHHAKPKPEAQNLAALTPQAKQAPSSPALPQAQASPQPVFSSLAKAQLVPEQKHSPFQAPSTPIQLRLTSTQSHTSLPDAQALTDLQTPSFPAPPLAPTEQERLVLLMLRHGEKHDLAELESTQADAAFRRRRSEFSSFFDPPLPPEGTTEQASDPLPPASADPVKSAPAVPSSSAPQTQPSGDPQ